MSGFNKATSFILGLIVVLVFLFVFGSRVNLSDKLLAFKNVKATPTPKIITVTPTPIAKKKGFFESLFARKTTPTPKITKIVENNVKGTASSTTTTTATSAMTTQPKTIPQTGSPTVLLPILISALGSGIYLRKKN